MIYTYTPEDFFDLGDAGEHQVTYTAKIERDPYSVWGKESYTCELKTALVTVNYAGMKQSLNVMPRLKTYPGSVIRIEQEILKDYLKAQEAKVHDWDGDPAA